MRILTKRGLKGKNILFFAPAFFGYEQKIKQKMEELGANVDFYDERSVTSAFSRALLKITPNLFALQSKRYYQKIFDENQKEYDYILFIKGDMVPLKSLIEIRKQYPKAKICLYLYDSIKNVSCVAKKLPYFDIKYSFDRYDCQKYSGLKFRPLFFADEFKNESSQERALIYDISFCGTIHSDRYKIIKKVLEICESNHYRFLWFGYLQSKFMYYFYRCYRPEYKDTAITAFKFEKMSSAEIAEIVNSSACILDMQHPGQSGLTMRTIEMIGMQKKIITTNKEIKNYDFYCPENICVIDREKIKIESDFMTSPYKKIDEELYEKYSLGNWVMEILEVL